MFITFEGPENSGKSTHAYLLESFLKAINIPCILVREPGGTELGERIRDILLNQDLSPTTELLLFEAARAELVNRVINPALKEGKIVICDRFTDSTLAYQGYGKGLDISKIRKLNDVATGGLKPDLTFLLMVKESIFIDRLYQAKERDKFERQNLEFHRRVIQGFYEIASFEPERFVIIDSSEESILTIQEEIKTHFIKRRRY